MKNKIKNESGSEAIEFLLLIPLLISFIFVIIDVSIYFNARATVQDITRDAARQVAIQGGNNSPLNPSNQTIAQQTYDLLVDGDSCTPGSCSEMPVVVCSPTIVRTLGAEVQCTTTYHHNPLTVDMFGFTDFLQDFTVTQYARSETYF